MKIRLTIDLELDSNVYGSSAEEIDWMKDQILVADGSIALHSNEIGDELGKVIKVQNVQIMQL